MKAAARQGSSVGCYQVNQVEDLSEAINKAFTFSDQVLVEKSVVPENWRVSLRELGR
ncbi:hypothetical protein O9929_25445 [Vibrio lentus]|nr:hypothetical protein [Vibrio lentus]